MSGPSPKRIDFSGARLVGKSGKDYFIGNDLSAIRYTYFMAYQPMITKGSTYQEWAEANNQIFALLTSGNDVMGNIHKAATIAYNQVATFKEFEETRYHAVMYFVMLFINETNEDVGVWDLRTTKLKIEDLDHYSMQDFFFLVNKVLKTWQDDYQRLTGADPLNDERIQGKTVAETLIQGTGITSS